MKILVINSGSSSLKFQVIDSETERVLAKGDVYKRQVKTSPLPKIRQADGSMKEVTWDEGFSHVADKLKELQEKYGKESVAGISTGQLTMEEFALFGHVMRNYLGTNVDGNTPVSYTHLDVYKRQGDKGCLTLDADGAVYFYKHERAEVVVLNTGRQQGEEILQPEMKYTEMEYGFHMFLDSLEQGDVPETSLEDNVKSFAMVMACLESAKQGMVVDCSELLRQYAR